MHVAFALLVFLERLAALVPPPRVHLASVSRRARAGFDLARRSGAGWGWLPAHKFIGSRARSRRIPSTAAPLLVGGLDATGLRAGCAAMWGVPFAAASDLGDHAAGCHRQDLGALGARDGSAAHTAGPRSPAARARVLNFVGRTRNGLGPIPDGRRYAAGLPLRAEPGPKPTIEASNGWNRSTEARSALRRPSGQVQGPGSEPRACLGKAACIIYPLGTPGEAHCRGYPARPGAGMTRRFRTRAGPNADVGRRVTRACVLRRASGPARGRSWER